MGSKGHSDVQTLRCDVSWRCWVVQVLRHMCEGLVALLMERADYHKFMMRSVARDLLASLVFRPIMQHMTPYNINKVLPPVAAVTF